MFNGPVTIEAGAILSPGNLVGNITFGQGLNLNFGSIVNVDFGGIVDRIVVSGGILTGPGGDASITLNLFDRGGFQPGVYTLIDFSGASLSDFQTADFKLGHLPMGSASDYALQLDSTSLKLIVPVPEPSSIGILIGSGCLLGLVRFARASRASNAAI